MELQTQAIQYYTDGTFPSREQAIAAHPGQPIVGESAAPSANYLIFGAEKSVSAQIEEAAQPIKAALSSMASAELDTKSEVDAAKETTSKALSDVASSLTDTQKTGDSAVSSMASTTLDIWQQSDDSGEQAKDSSERARLTASCMAQQILSLMGAPE